MDEPAFDLLAVTSRGSLSGHIACTTTIYGWHLLHKIDELFVQRRQLCE